MFFCDENDVAQIPINALQLVNHQLRAETAGLEIQHNRIHFTRFPRKKKTSIDGLSLFVDRCTPSRLSWLRHVLLDPETDYSKAYMRRVTPLSWISRHIEEVLKLQEFCVAQPHVRVDYRVPGFTAPTSADPRIETRKHILEGMILTRIFRKDNFSSMKLSQEVLTRINRDLSIWLKSKLIRLESLSLQCPGLHLYPHSQVLDEQFWRDNIDDGIAWLPCQADLGDLEACLEFARGWIANGI